MTPLLRYILIQIPGWLFIGLLLVWATRGGWLETTTALIITAAWLIKDAALYPLCRRALETGPATGAAALIGRTGTTATALDPDGQIRIDGERWLARSRDGEPLPRGQSVHVTGHEGLVLIVHGRGPDEEAATAAAMPNH